MFASTRKAMAERAAEPVAPKRKSPALSSLDKPKRKPRKKAAEK